MRVLIAFALCALVSVETHAKCADRFLLISGLVVDEVGKPMAGVMVGVAWTMDDEPAGPALAMTDSQGRYAVPVIYPTYSGHWPLGADRCNAVLGQVSIAAYGSTHRSRPLLLDIEGKANVTVETLRLDTLIERKPTWPDGTED